MKQFTDDFIAYLQGHLNNDNDLKAKVKVGYAYKRGKMEVPCVEISVVGGGTNSAYDTFDEGACVVSLQCEVLVYTNQMSIGGVTFSAQDSAIILADKIQTLCDKIRLAAWNKNLITVSRSGDDGSTPFKSGTTSYSVALQYTFGVNADYEKL